MPITCRELNEINIGRLPEIGEFWAEIFFLGDLTNWILLIVFHMHLDEYILYIYYIYSIHTRHIYKWSMCTSQSVFSDIKSNNSVLLWSLFSCQSTLETGHSGVEFQFGIPKSSVLPLYRRVWGGWTLFCFLRAAHILCDCCSQDACLLGKRSSPPSWS